MRFLRLKTGLKDKTATEAVASGSPTDLIHSYLRSFEDCSLDSFASPSFDGFALFSRYFSEGSSGHAGAPHRLPAFGGPTSVTLKLKVLAMRLCVSVFRSDLPCTKGSV